MIGGGVHGLFAAYDAAARGLSVALVERRTLAAACRSTISARSTAGCATSPRPIPQGARADPRTATMGADDAALDSSAALRRRHVGSTSRSKAAMRAGLIVYDSLGRSRNSSMPPDLRLPKATPARATTWPLFPGVGARGSRARPSGTTTRHCIPTG